MNASPEGRQAIPFLASYFDAGQQVSAQLLDTLPVPPSLDSALAHAETVAYINFVAGFFLGRPSPERIRQALLEVAVLLPQLLTIGDPEALAAACRKAGIDQRTPAN